MEKFQEFSPCRSELLFCQPEKAQPAPSSFLPHTPHLCRLRWGNWEAIFKMYHLCSWRLRRLDRKPNFPLQIKCYVSCLAEKRHQYGHRKEIINNGWEGFSAGSCAGEWRRLQVLNQSFCFSLPLNWSRTFKGNPWSLLCYWAEVPVCIMLFSFLLSSQPPVVFVKF